MSVGLLGGLKHVDGAQDLGDRALVLGDEADGLVAQRRHALLDRERAQLCVRRVADDELFHLVGHGEDLVDAEPVVVTGVTAEVAADAGHEVGRLQRARILV